MLPMTPNAAAALPVPAIDWYYHFQFRALANQLIDQGADLPRYLLAPEVAALVQASPHYHGTLLLQLLFNSGARIGEALALTPADVVFAPDGTALLSLINLKRRGKGRPRKDDKPPRRIVPLLDTAFVAELRRYLATHCNNKKKPVFASARDDSVAISDQTARNWLAAARTAAEAQGHTFPPGITIHSLRHSYAIHLLLSGIRMKQLQLWLGHSSPDSTEIYTRLLSLDTGICPQGISFTVTREDNPLLTGR